MFFYSLNVMPWDLATRRVLKPGDQINPVFYNFFNAFFSFNTSNLYPENKFVCFVLFFFCFFVCFFNQLHNQEVQNQCQSPPQCWISSIEIWKNILPNDCVACTQTDFKR